MLEREPVVVVSSFEAVLCHARGQKLCILSADRSTLLNKRSELITKCRHENKFYAANQKQDRSNRPP